MKILNIFRVYKIVDQKILIPMCDSKGVIVHYYEVPVDAESVSRFAGLPCPIGLFISEETHILDSWLMKNNYDLTGKSFDFFKEIIHDVGVDLETIFIYS